MFFLRKGVVWHDGQPFTSRVADIQRKLEVDAARPVMGWGLDFFAQWPYVKGLVPHNNIYNYGRLQEVWLDR